MDKDDFAQWKDSHATQWVLARLEKEADRVEAATKEALFGGAREPPSAWPTYQIVAAENNGYVRAIREMIDLNLEDINDEPERDKPD